MKMFAGILHIHAVCFVSQSSVISHNNVKQHRVTLTYVIATVCVSVRVGDRHTDADKNTITYQIDCLGLRFTLVIMYSWINQYWVSSSPDVSAQADTHSATVTVKEL